MPLSMKCVLRAGFFRVSTLGQYIVRETSTSAQYFRTIYCTGNQYFSAVLVRYPAAMAALVAHGIFIDQILNGWEFPPGWGCKGFQAGSVLNDSTLQGRPVHHAVLVKDIRGNTHWLAGPLLQDDACEMFSYEDWVILGYFMKWKLCSQFEDRVTEIDRIHITL
jgi:hypothetical protein